MVESSIIDSSSSIRSGGLSDDSLVMVGAGMLLVGTKGMSFTLGSGCLVGVIRSICLSFSMACLFSEL